MFDEFLLFDLELEVTAKKVANTLLNIDYYWQILNIKKYSMNYSADQHCDFIILFRLTTVNL